MTHAAYLLSSIDLSQKNLASLWPLSHICIYWAIPGKAVPWEVSATQPLSEITGANMKKQKKSLDQYGSCVVRKNLCVT